MCLSQVHFKSLQYIYSMKKNEDRNEMKTVINPNNTTGDDN